MQHHLRIEHGEQRAQVTAARGGEERVGHLPLPGQAAPGNRGRAAYPAAGAAGQLADRGRRAAGDRRDLVERQAERVVQHERDPFSGRERIEHHEHREPDRVREHRLLLGTGNRRLLDVQRLLAPRLARAQHVQAHPGDDGREPSLDVVHGAPAGAGGVNPAFLDRVLGVAQGAEHPVGHRPQARATRLEPPGQPVVVVHRSHFPCRVPSYP